jgi:hypothetical protein
LEAYHSNKLQATLYIIIKNANSFFLRCSSSSSNPPPLQKKDLTSSHPNLLGDTNDTASRTSASVASLLALLVLALAEIVGAGVDNNSATKNALRADQLDELVRDGALGVALGVGLEVAQVADVALAVGGGAVGLVVGVDCEEREVLVDERLVGGREDVLFSRSFKTYSEDRRWCSRWCCHRRCGCACRARRWHRCR